MAGDAGGEGWATLCEVEGAGHRRERVIKITFLFSEEEWTITGRPAPGCSQETGRTHTGTGSEGEKRRKAPWEIVIIPRQRKRVS